MDKIVQPTQPVVGVPSPLAAASQVATLDLAIGPRYHAIWLEVTATAAAAKTIGITDLLDLLTLKINGKPQRQHTANELNQINTQFDAACAANLYNVVAGVPVESQGPQVAGTTMLQIGIFLAEPWRKSYAATDMMAWYTAWQDGSKLNSLQLEITCPAASANIDTTKAYSIKAYAETDNVIGPLDANKRPIGLITKFRRLGVPYAGAGDLYLTTLNKAGFYNQLTMFGQAGSGDDITHVKVTRDSQIIRDVDKWRNDQTLLGRQFNPAALSVDRFDMVFDYSDVPTDGLSLNGVADFQVIMTLSAATAPNKLIQTIAQVYEQADF